MQFKTWVRLLRFSLTWSSFSGKRSGEPSPGFPSSATAGSGGLGISSPTISGLGTRKKNMNIPRAPIIAPGTMNESPQLSSTNAPAKMEPTMFPTEVWEFQIPKIRPFLPLPNQWAMMVTTPGQPVLWANPHTIYKAYSFWVERGLMEGQYRIKTFGHFSFACLLVRRWGSRWCVFSGRRPFQRQLSRCQTSASLRSKSIGGQLFLRPSHCREKSQLNFNQIELKWGNCDCFAPNKHPGSIGE